jgi:(E)-4-hydroxy-3-methylbut-2-enyl-diphosphate synthase
VKEIKVAKEILKALEIRKGLEIISCPTCGRTDIPLIKLVKEVEDKLKPFEHMNIKIAVMGCEVNGPGEAREADFGIAGGKNEGLLFKKGEVLKKVATDRLVDALVEMIDIV